MSHAGFARVSSGAAFCMSCGTKVEGSPPTAGAPARTDIAEHRGYEVKTEGDAFMVAFQSARDALRCAIDVQRAFEEGAHPLLVRVGLHTGEPVRKGGDDAADFYGTHVVMASRIASLAAGGEVLVSALMRELVASSGEFTLDARPPAALKGLGGEHVTYAVGWA